MIKKKAFSIPLLFFSVYLLPHLLPHLLRVDMLVEHIDMEAIQKVTGIEKSDW